MAHQDRLGMDESWVENWENVALAHKLFSTQSTHIAMSGSAYSMRKDSFEQHLLRKNSEYTGCGHLLAGRDLLELGFIHQEYFWK